MIKIEVDSREIAAALQKLKKAVTDMRPAFDEIGKGLVDNIQLQLGQGETPWGDPFDELADATKIARFRGGKKYNKNGATSAKFYRHMTGNFVPLNDTGEHIYNRITHNPSSTGVEVGMLDSDTAPIGPLPLS